MSDCVVAIDVGGTNLKGALVDRRGRAVSVARRATQVEAGSDAVVEAVLGLASELAEFAVHAVRDANRGEGSSGLQRPVAVGLAVPGLVEERTGTVLDATNLHWRNLAIGPLAERRLGARVSVSHDVRAGAVAEGLLGAARGHRDFLLLTLGTGIGAAVVIGGHAYTGAHGLGGELGHAAVDPRGPICGCGRRGCLEALASAGHIASRYREMTGGEIGAVSAERVAELAAAGDPIAELIWREAIDALGLAIANYAALLDPELVVIGGGMAAAGEGLFAPLHERLIAHTRFGEPPPVAPAALGEEAGRHGAAIAAWRAAGIRESELACWTV